MTETQPQNESAESGCHVVWLFNCIGAAGSLMYWGGILPAYLSRFPNSWFYTARPPSLPIPKTDKTVDCIGSIKVPLGRRRGSYERQLVIGSPRIVGVTKRQSPDVIVIQEFLSFAAYFALFRWRLPRTKILLLLESDPVRGIPSRNRYWTRAVRKWIAQRVDCFLTNNEAGKSYLVDQLQVSASRVVVHPYLVSEVGSTDDSWAQLPDGIHRDEQQVVFLYVGQLIERKGVGFLIRAVASMETAHREKVAIWLVGDGEQRKQLEELARELQVDDIVQFLGRQPYDQLGSIYRNSDVFVMPTLDDYRALVGFEAIGYGLPLLHSKYDGAVTEVVQDGDNGFSIDPRDTEQLAERIAWFIDNPDAGKEMGRKSQSRSAAFTIDNAVNGICEAIEFCRQYENG